MSYDVDLTIDTGGPEPAQVGDNWNYMTSNTPVWRVAAAALSNFDGKLAGECHPHLKAAIQTIYGLDWKSSDYSRFIDALEELAASFAAHPKATVRVSV